MHNGFTSNCKKPMNVLSETNLLLTAFFGFIRKSIIRLTT